MDPQFSLPSAYRLAATRSWGQRHSVTVVPTGQATGAREFLHLRPGFYVAACEVRHSADSREIYASGDFLKMHFRLLGESLVCQPGSAPQAVPAMSASALLQPPKTHKEERFTHDVHERSVTVCCSRAFLADEMGLGAGLDVGPGVEPALGGPLGDFLRAPASDFQLTQFPLDARLRTAAESLLDFPSSGQLRALHTEARALDLLYGFIASSSSGAAKAGACAGEPREQLEPLRAFIETHLDQPLDMQRLARRFGFSEGSLARSFKQAFGMPVFEYVRETRAQRARVLLEESRKSITEIALEVGYGHTANFSTAFRRHFGMSPRAARKAAQGVQDAHAA